MENNINLANAAVVGENPEEGFIVEGKRLHAVDKAVAALKKQNNTPKQIVPLIKDALNALITYAKDKVEPHFLENARKVLSEKSEDQSALIANIEQIYIHLQHHDRNSLSTLIHHPQKSH